MDEDLLDEFDMEAYRKHIASHRKLMRQHDLWHYQSQVDLLKKKDKIIEEQTRKIEEGTRKIEEGTRKIEELVRKIEKMARENEEAYNFFEKIAKDNPLIKADIEKALAPIKTKKE